MQKLKDAIVGPAGRAGQGAGAQAEALAASFLQGQGLEILARNVRYPGGELDLICRDGAALVFVEVRLRTNPRFGSAAASITPAKRRRVVHAAQRWLSGAGRPHADCPCRFDAVLLERLDAAAITWLPAAFDAE